MGCHDPNAWTQPIASVDVPLSHLGMGLLRQRPVRRLSSRHSCVQVQGCIPWKQGGDECEIGQ